MVITDRDHFDPLRLGLEIAHQLVLLHGDSWQIDSYLKLLGSEATLEAIRDGRSVEDIEAVFETDLENFRNRRKQFLLYD